MSNDERECLSEYYVDLASDVIDKGKFWESFRRMDEDIKSALHFSDLGFPPETVQLIYLTDYMVEHYYKYHEDFI